MNVDKFVKMLKENNYTLYMEDQEKELDLYITKDRNIIKMPIKKICGYAYGKPIYSKLEKVDNLQQLFQSIEYMARVNERGIDEFLNLLIEKREEYL